MSLSDAFHQFLSKMSLVTQRNQLQSILEWIAQTFPTLKQEIKWNQPMFIQDKTFIIGFSVSKNHIAVAPEAIVMERFFDRLQVAGYSPSSHLFRIRWEQDIPYDILRDIIEFNTKEKANYSTFWR